MDQKTGAPSSSFSSPSSSAVPVSATSPPGVPSATAAAVLQVHREEIGVIQRLRNVGTQLMQRATEVDWEQAVTLTAIASLFFLAVAWLLQILYNKVLRYTLGGKGERGKKWSFGEAFAWLTFIQLATWPIMS